MNTYTITEYQSLHVIVCSEDHTTVAGVTDYCISLDDAINRVLAYQADPRSSTSWHPHFIIELRPPRHNNQPRATSPAAPYITGSGQTNIYVSDPAWEHLAAERDRYGYAGRSSTTGMTHYIAALLAANPPTPEYWTDERPDGLTIFDEHRIKAGRFPVWINTDEIYSSDDWRRKRSVNAAHLTTLAPDLIKLANHFLIAPTRGDQLDVKNRCAAVLEAIGLQFLTPINEPQPNSSPRNEQRHNQYLSRRAQAQQALSY